MGIRVVSFARGRIYYGWAIVAVGFVIEFFFVSLRSYGAGLFLKPMTLEFGWTRATYSLVQSFSFAVDGLISPIIGPIIDKRGGRGLMIFGAIIGGGSIAALGLVQGLWDFYLLRGLVVTIGIVCAGPLVINVAISNWFIRKRGKAVALSLMGVSLGGAVLSPVITHLIVTYGWRWAWVICGVAVWVMIIPPVALLIKRRPEDIGLMPDGDAPAGDGGQGSGPMGLEANPISGPRPPTPIPHAESAWTRGEAVRTPALWLTVVAFGFANLGSAGVTLHLYAYLTDIGLPDVTAAMIFSAHAVALTAAKIVWGFVLDKFQVRHCAMTAFVFLAAVIALLAAVSLRPSVWLIFVIGILLGFGLAGQAPVQEVLWANYFGRLSLGAIRTVASPFSIIFSAGGPFFGGWAYDRYGSYQIAFAFFAASFIVGAFLVYFARPPQKKPQEEGVLRGR
ncbi:MAG: MFS transporter [Dehalococcoidia bacterium]|nr:MFS transporter [Dehalococcoidia bacterium]